jgi:hypothetical protein
MSMEKVKEIVNSKISNYHTNMNNFYAKYRQTVETFLKQSINTVSSSETM